MRAAYLKGEEQGARSLEGEVVPHMKKKKVACLFACGFLCAFGLCASTPAQTVLASVTGRVLDPNAAAIVEATVTAKNIDTGIETTVQTNGDGIYHFSDLGPGNYEFSVSKRGFKVIVKPGVTLHVADTVSMNFTMQVGDVRETVTVEGGAPLINTESAAVSTVVDRQFGENLPMNGRSFQTLIQLAPGVVVTPSSAYDSGQFSVNGQRSGSNYWMVDGVSANSSIIFGMTYSMPTTGSTAPSLQRFQRRKSDKMILEEPLVARLSMTGPFSFFPMRGFDSASLKPR